MLFNSLEFMFVFLPIAVSLHFFAARQSVVLATAVTAGMSLLFYAWWKPTFLLLPVVSIVFNFLLAMSIIRTKRRNARLLLTLGIAANLVVLVYFKYFDFFLSILENRAPGAPNVPLALSFTTFVQIAFLVEAYRKAPTVQFPAYALFVSFFPHLIAGPIVRWNELGPQLADKDRYRPNWENIARGLTIFCLGLAKKVLIADKLAGFVAPVFDAASVEAPITFAAAWGASIAYSLQLYFDFSGYSDMAVGLGLLFNLRLPINFAAPFRSTSIIDLWRRWHISLSRFLRDFVYVPLGGNERGPIKRSLNLIITMVVGGFWHGANWTFICWGAFHGILLTLNHLWRSFRGARQSSAAGKLVGWFMTFAAFAVGMAMFRANDIGGAGRMLAAMAGMTHGPESPPIMVEFDSWAIRSGYFTDAFVRRWLGSYWSVVGSLATLLALAIALAIPDTMELVQYDEGGPRSKWRRAWNSLRWSPSLAWGVTVLVLFAIAFANMSTFTEFLYYQF